MNRIEKGMLELLRELKQVHSAVAVKAEFEAEGTRLEELYRLVDITRRAGLKLAIKIGGCEAIKDILDAKQVGVDYLIAPMIESEYALAKYGHSLHRTYGEDDIMPSSLFNLETCSGFKYRQELLSYAGSCQSLKGVVFCRVDYCLSSGLSRDAIDSTKVEEDCLVIANESKRQDLEFVVGGGVSRYSVSFLRRLREVRLDRFETRKIVFDQKALEDDKVAEGLLKAVKFELLWLINKKNYYSTVGAEDDARIDMLQSRWNVLSNKDG